jgi:hypothetical protein
MVGVSKFGARKFSGWGYVELPLAGRLEVARATARMFAVSFSSNPKTQAQVANTSGREIPAIGAPSSWDRREVRKLRELTRTSRKLVADSENCCQSVSKSGSDLVLMKFGGWLAL